MQRDNPRRRGPGKKPAMVHVTLRMPKHVIDRYPDLKTMRDDWVRYVESLPYPGKQTGVDTV
jgi:hypothetical protein